VENYEAEVLVDTVNNVEWAYMAKESVLAEWADDDRYDVVTSGDAQELAEKLGLDDLAGHSTHDFDSALVDWEEVAAFWTLEMREYIENTALVFEPVKGATAEVW